MTKIWTRDEIDAKIQTSDQWLVRALLTLLARQTADEQQAQTTIYSNAMGFNAADAQILTSFAQQAQTWIEGRSRYRDPLSPKPAIARKKLRKYTCQLEAITNSQAN